jgi:tetratricopeptide (TPR) repeat protein
LKQALRACFFLVTAALLSACRVESPQANYDRIRQEIGHGQLDAALQHLDQIIVRHSAKDEWGWRFRILKARILVLRKQPQEALTLLDPDVPVSLTPTEIPGLRKLTQGMAYRSAQHFAQARRSFEEAESMSGQLSPSVRCELLIAEGNLAIDERAYAQAGQRYGAALALARQERLPLLELTVLTDLGWLEPSEEHFDRAIDVNRSALQLSYSMQAHGQTATILGNLAWSYSELGDFESALDFFKQGAEASRSSGLPVLTAYWLTGIANSEIALRDYAAAEKLAQETLQQAEKLKNAQTIVECRNILTRTALRTGRLDEAEKHNQAALAMERSGADHFGLPDSLILAGQIAIARGRYQDAEQSFQEVLRASTVETPLRWQAQAGLAGVRDGQGKVAEAEDFYKTAIAMIETARSSINHEELRVSFLSSGIAVYGDYIDFLVRHGRTDDALVQADLSRARTLAEGLSAAPGAKSPRAPRNTAFQAVPLRSQQLAQRLHATLLVYWLGEKQSFLWTVTPTRTQCHKLPPAAEIDALVKTYREATLKSADVLSTAAAAETGQKLYHALVEPALGPALESPVEAVLSGRPDALRNTGILPVLPSANVGARFSAFPGQPKPPAFTPPTPRFIILPDGSLNGLNFETLIVANPQPHFWIEDATITTANSLSLLQAAANRPRTAQRNLLLVGDAVPVPQFGELPQAKSEIAKLRERFASKRGTILQGPAATPSAYLGSHPEHYSYLHFVTHGTASRARPLESAVILSKEPQSDTYKLYARDIISRPLKAELVTISACNGSGTRSYSGEGLVGLSWAFLRAGAHNVVGALWEVSDVSTPNLMDKMYAELAAGRDPATALRNAKLSLLHQHNVFSKPFYWAPFQLYSGS